MSYSNSSSSSSSISVKPTRLDNFLTDANPLLSKYKEDLERLRQCESAVDQDYLRNRIQEVYREGLGFSTSDINRHMAEVLGPPPLDHKIRYSLEELMDAYDPSENWIVPKLLFSQGLYLVAAEPKVGKSLLLYDLAYGFAVSGIFLGMPCKRGKVLYYQCEEPRNTIARRLQTRGFQDADSIFQQANDSLVIMRKFSLHKDLENFQDVLDEEKPDVIIFDSLRAISSDATASENSVDYCKYIYALQRLLALNEVCGVLVHHLNKQGLVAGNLGIEGAVDGIISMKKERGEPAECRHILTKPRNGSFNHLKIRRVSGEGGRWNFELEEDMTLNDSDRLLQEKMLRWFSKNSGQPYTKVDICKGTGLNTTDRQVDFALSQLCDDMIIYSRVDPDTRNFIYELPERSIWINAFTKPSEGTDSDDAAEEPQLNQVLFGEETKIAETLITLSTVEEIQALESSVNPQIWSKAWAVLLPQEQQRLIRIPYPPVAVEGDTLEISGDTFSIQDAVYDFDAQVYTYVLNDGTRLDAETVSKYTASSPEIISEPLPEPTSEAISEPLPDSDPPEFTESLETDDLLNWNVEDLTFDFEEEVK